MAGATVYSTLTALEDIDVNEDEIKTSPDNSKEAQEKYLGTIFESISGDIMDLMFNQPQEIVLLFSVNQTDSWELYDDQQKENIKTKFLEHAVKFQQAYDELREVFVPSTWSDLHTKVLTLLKKLELYHRSIALSTDDALKQMIVLGNLQNVYMESQPILTAIANRIQNNRLDAPHSDFFSINSLLSP